jgi:hypothetical protein
MMVSTVEAVDQLLPLDPRLFGASIDKPTTGQRVETAAINVWGWVLGRDARVRFVEILSDLGPPTRVPVSIDRPHVADAFPDVPLAARSGFAAVVDLRCARRTDSFVLQAGLPDGSKVTLGAVYLSHHWCSLDPQVSDLASVIICATGDEAATVRTADSISAQTYNRIEQVVVSSEENRRFDGRLFARQRNAGVRRSNGDFLLFVEGGVTLESTAIATGVGALQSDTALAAIRLRGTGAPSGQETVLYRRAALRSVGYFIESTSASPDGDLIARLERYGLVGVCESGALRALCETSPGTPSAPTTIPS